MPKNKSISKSDTGAVLRSRSAHKLRIGTRKSGKSGLQMSTEELKAALENSNLKSDHTNALVALKMRGYTAIN